MADIYVPPMMYFSHIFCYVMVAKAYGNQLLHIHLFMYLLKDTFKYD